MMKHIKIFLLSSFCIIFFASCGGRQEINYWKNGTIKSEGAIINHKKNGKWVYYSKDGNIEAIINYKDDHRNGYYYYNSGTGLEIKGYYVEGKKHGIWKRCTYDETTNAYFEEGILQDRVMYIDTVNSILRIIQIKNGKSDGIEYIFDFKKNQIFYDIAEPFPFVFLFDPDTLPQY